MPFENESFEFVLSSDALHHFNDSESVIKETKRVLKDGGFLLLVDPSADGRTRKLMINFIGGLLETASRYYSRQDIETLLKENGFEVVSEFYYYFNNFVLAKKYGGK